MSDELKDDRTCANCACYWLQVSALNSAQSQGFCRRNTPIHARGRVEVPRLDRDKNAVIGRDGKPVMENMEKDFYLYPPTMPTMVCFDGWRSLEIKPGEKQKTDIASMLSDIQNPEVLAALNRLRDQILMSDNTVQWPTIDTDISLTDKLLAESSFSIDPSVDKD